MTQCVLFTLTKVFPKPGLFEASKGSRHIGFVVGVDEHGSCLQFLSLTYMALLMSRVKTPEARPNSVLLALLRTPSTSLMSIRKSY